MAATRRPIESLLNGISQQAPSLRHTSQAEAQVNGLSSIAEGLVKRPAMEHIEKVTASTWTTPYMFTYDRSATEKFVIVLINGDLFAFDDTGTAVTVNFPAGKAYLGGMTNVVAAHAQVEDKAYIVNKLAKCTTAAATAGGTYIGKLQDTAALLAVVGPTNGDTYLIVGDGTIKAQGYYMQWNGTTNVWEEAANPGDKTTLNASLMPWVLTYSTATGQFTFNSVTWAVKGAGDTVITPDPDFLEREITDVFFYRNRLGFLAGEYCLLSQSGPNYEYFWAWTATAQLDNDRIVFRSSNVRTSQLNHAVPFNKQLAIFSDSAQFILSTAIGQALTPTTGSLDVATHYAANSVAKPVSAGNSVFFPSEDKSWAQMRQYKVSSDAEIVNEAEDITAHVPKFLPIGLRTIELAENDDMLFAISSEEPNRIYVYKYFATKDDQALQTSWSYWEFDSGTEILNIAMMDSKLYVLGGRSDGMHLLRISLSDDGTVADLGFPVMLDHRIKPGGTYSAVTNLTTWTTVYDNSALALQVILAGGHTAPGARLQGVLQPTATTVTAPGDWTADNVYIGSPYTFEYEFSEQFVRRSSANSSGSPVLVGNLHLRNFAVRYNDTGYLRAEVVPRSGAQTYTYLYSGRTIGAASLVINSPDIGTGTFLFPVVAHAKACTIKLLNDSHMPSKIISAEWTGNFTSKKGV